MSSHTSLCGSFSAGEADATTNAPFLRFARALASRVCRHALSGGHSSRPAGYTYGASIVFEDGVFDCSPMIPPPGRIVLSRLFARRRLEAAGPGRGSRRRCRRSDSPRHRRGTRVPRLRCRCSTAARISSAFHAVQSSLSGNPGTPALRPAATILTARRSEPYSLAQGQELRGQSDRRQLVHTRAQALPVRPRVLCLLVGPLRHLPRAPGGLAHSTAGPVYRHVPTSPTSPGP